GLSSAVLLGSAAGIWISALSTLVADMFVLRKPAVRVAFNASQIALATGVGALLFDWLGGRGAVPVLPGGAGIDRAHATALMLPFAGLVLVSSPSIGGMWGLPVGGPPGAAGGRRRSGVCW